MDTWRSREASTSTGNRLFYLWRPPLGGAGSLVRKKIHKFFSLQPLKSASLRSGEFIEGVGLYKMASRQIPRVLTFTARGRQIFEELEISAGPQHFVYNLLSVWTIVCRAGRWPLPESVFVRSKIVR
jgi:hypothetical protein